jgi:ABC-2 type transport system ATP-binding protein
MPGVVALEGLTKSFGRSRGVSDLTLEVEPGQVFGFLGPNGAGKSTTIRMIMGLYAPTSGSVSALGFDCWSQGVLLRRRVGYLPGDLALFPRLTGREILDRVARARGGVDPDLRQHLVARFAAEIDRPIRTLSKGNVQKIGLVLAFMHRPQLLVLDEPTSGLDPLMQDEFAHLLEETVAEGRTIFLSSHDLGEVQRVAHQVGIIREGRLVTVDTVEGLRSHAPRTIELRFRRSLTDVAAFAALPGASVLSYSGDRIVLSVEGDVGPLLALAVPLEPVDLVARPADLDELFRSFYATSAESDRIHAI